MYSDMTLDAASRQSTDSKALIPRHGETNAMVASLFARALSGRNRNRCLAGASSRNSSITILGDKFTTLNTVPIKPAAGGGGWCVARAQAARCGRHQEGDLSNSVLVNEFVPRYVAAYSPFSACRASQCLQDAAKEREDPHKCVQSFRGCEQVCGGSNSVGHPKQHKTASCSRPRHGLHSQGSLRRACQNAQTGGFVVQGRGHLQFG